MDCGRSSHAWNHACVGPPLKQCANQSRKVKGLLSHWLVPSSGSFFDTATILHGLRHPMESHPVKPSDTKSPSPLLPLLFFFHSFLPFSSAFLHGKRRNKHFSNPNRISISCLTKHVFFFFLHYLKGEKKSSESSSARRRLGTRGGTSGSSPPAKRFTEGNGRAGNEMTRDPRRMH